jgi:CRP/FNR family transcriptional regulator, cyclic AMP receptor protein
MKAEYIKEMPFFNKFSKHDMEKASSFSREKWLNRGSFIFMEGDSGDQFYIIISGLVEINRYENGKKFVLSTLQAGDFFGEMALLEEDDLRSANAEVLERTSLLAIDRCDLLSFLETYPSVSYQLLTTLTRRLRKTNEQMHDITFLDVRSRVYKKILSLADEYGVVLNQQLIINLRLTHQQISDMIGCTREMVTKVLIELQAEGVIDVIKKKIIINNKIALSEKIVNDLSG